MFSDFGLILNFGITKPDQVQTKWESVFQFTSDKLVFKSVSTEGNQGSVDTDHVGGRFQWIGGVECNQKF